MALIRISEADALHDFASLLAQVRAGSEVVIEGDGVPVAMLVPPTVIDPEHDMWFRGKVQEAIDDTRPEISEEEIEAYFVQRRAASLLRVERS